MSTAPAVAAASQLRQRTLRRDAICGGVGLHSGAEVTLCLHPAAEDAGIRFRRVDIASTHNSVAADWRNVVDGARATTIANGHGVRIALTEHLMAALAATGVDNAMIDIDGPEIPVLDGSAAPFVDLIEGAGTEPQDAPRRAIEILKPVIVVDGDRRAALMPATGFEIDFTIDYPTGAIGRQSMAARDTAIDFRTEICPARTFCLETEIEALQKSGLGRGGSLDNTVVVGADGILNPGGLRFPDEFVRHKILDCLGDLYLLGRPLIGRFEGVRSGHAMTHAVLAALAADEEAWRETDLG